MAQRSQASSAHDDASAEAAVEAAVASATFGVVAPAPHLVEALARWPATAGDPAERALARVLVAAVADAWRNGWQPADVHRVVERRAGRAPARLVARPRGW